MMLRTTFFLIILSASIYGCGKEGPLNLPKDKLDKSVISYPCDEECMKKFEEEKIRQQSVTIQTD